MVSLKAGISKKPFRLSGFTSSPWNRSRRSPFSPKLERSELDFDTASPAKEWELTDHIWSFLELLAPGQALRRYSSLKPTVEFYHLRRK